ncbi:hypothetical protein FHX37_4113 [Haloactinospora alba]|uniref:Uncharacterized protein n=2 Tax=Haloactinospora alba TaxID=405555 RepID=A0A543NAB2_9ACTN|nr:hypothetical protein FHX37_4113 [Haloactinospora alba]
MRLLRRDGPEHGGARLPEGFPGRWLSGISLATAPVLLLAGELLKAPFHFYFPDQIAAHGDRPGRLFWAYSLWFLGLLMLWPAFVALAARIARSRPWLGRAVGALTIVGLLVNSFYEGVNYLAFRLSEVSGEALATHLIEEIYPRFSIAYALTWTDNLGWLLLAVGLLLTRTVGVVRFLCILPMAGHASGILKGFTVGGVVLDVLLCVAFVSLAVETARDNENR